MTVVLAVLAVWVVASVPVAVIAGMFITHERRGRR